MLLQLREALSLRLGTPRLEASLALSITPGPLQEPQLMHIISGPMQPSVICIADFCSPRTTDYGDYRTWWGFGSQCHAKNVLWQFQNFPPHRRREFACPLLQHMTACDSVHYNSLIPATVNIHAPFALACFRRPSQKLGWPPRKNELTCSDSTSPFLVLDLPWALPARLQSPSSFRCKTWSRLRGAREATTLKCFSVFLRMTA